MSCIVEGNETSPRLTLVPSKGWREGVGVWEDLKECLEGCSSNENILVFGVFSEKVVELPIQEEGNQ